MVFCMVDIFLLKCTYFDAQKNLVIVCDSSGFGIQQT